MTVKESLDRVKRLPGVAELSPEIKMKYFNRDQLWSSSYETCEMHSAYYL